MKICASISHQFIIPSERFESFATQIHFRPHSQIKAMAQGDQIKVQMGGDENKSKIIDKAIVVGGGLGGLTAALLLRSRGIDVQIFEKRETISGGEGTLISIFPNGCRVLQKMGPDILNRFRSAGLPDTHSYVVHPNGEKLSEWTLSSQMEATYGLPVIPILWQDALRILSEALPDDCKNTGYECTGISQNSAGATAHFRKGNENLSVEAPLIIGADGIRSVVRTELFGPISIHDNGRTIWRAVIDSSLCTHKALRTGSTVAVGDGLTMFLVNGVREKLYWCLSIRDGHGGTAANVRSKDPQEAKQRLLNAFKDWELANQIIQATEPELILERRVLDVPVLPQWYKGSVVLLGDSVHAIPPSLGQGANLAFEDGDELAFQLSSSTDLRNALSNYQEKRLPRVQVIYEKSQQLGNQSSQDFYDWLYTYSHNSASTVPAT